MRFLSVLLAALFVCCSMTPARAGAVTERVKARGLVRCGSARRPGLADTDGRGRWTGLQVEVCRGIAAAVLGSPDRIDYHEYETAKQFDGVRNQDDDVYFVTGSEIAEQGLAGKIVPGPTVFVESHNVMVPSGSAARHVSDLAGQPICFLTGSQAERSLADYFDTFHKSFLHLPFSEEGEMNDAYSAQRCRAVAGEITTLAAARLDPGVSRLGSRILPEPLSVFPVIAATGTSDGQWSAVVAWTVITLVSGERHETRWYAGGAGAMPVIAPELGLDGQWQRRALAASGSYGDIFERYLGKGSRLKLDRGLNANRFEGGQLLCPFLE
jgi:general L-amino acid transport system substrate-binding protein